MTMNLIQILLPLNENDGAIYSSGAEDHRFHGDLEAIEAARKFRAGDPIAIWQLGRSVARVSAEGKDSEATDRISG